MSRAVALPPEDTPLDEAAATPRPELRLIEASEARERRCADCGKATTAWKPVRRKGTSVILCAECAAKAPSAEGGCPQCGAALEPHDAFCGRCGGEREYAWPQCDASLDPEDTFCGKCGSKIG